MWITDTIDLTKVRLEDQDGHFDLTVEYSYHHADNGIRGEYGQLQSPPIDEQWDIEYVWFHGLDITKLIDKSKLIEIIKEELSEY